MCLSPYLGAHTGANPYLVAHIGAKVVHNFEQIKNNATTTLDYNPEVNQYYGPFTKNPSNNYCPF